MGGDRIGYVQYLRDGEVVEVAIGMLDALFRAGTIRGRGPPVGYAVPECDVGQRCPGDYAQAWNAPAQARDQAHERQKNREMLDDVMAATVGGLESGGGRRSKW